LKSLYTELWNKDRQFAEMLDDMSGLGPMCGWSLPCSSSGSCCPSLPLGSRCSDRHIEPCPFDSKRSCPERTVVLPPGQHGSRLPGVHGGGGTYPAQAADYESRLAAWRDWQPATAALDGKK
jgi:hypothetical protein